MKIKRATALLEGLGGEKQRWGDNSEDLTARYQNLVGDMLICAANIAYLGSFTSKYRISTLRTWIQNCQDYNLNVSHNVTLENTLGEPVTIRKWNIYSLPTDSFSKENAIIVFNGRRWPLMMDPQGQANRWIKNLEHENHLNVVKLSDLDFLRNFKKAIQFGEPLLLENLGEELDPSLEGVLSKQIFKNAGMWSIKLADEIIDYSNDFRLYMTTKIPNPHYLPQISTKVTLINFMITYKGLRDQLLDLVVQKEKPALEEKRTKLINESYENKKKLKECEERILEVLRTTKGDILNNEDAINILNDSQTLAKEFQEKQAIAEVTEQNIEENRRLYNPIADHSSLLFFIISNLGHIDVMYQYSLSWFIQLFGATIDNSEQSDYVDERIKILTTDFTYSLYENICRSLFQKDKLLFSFLLTATIQQSENAFTIPEYKFFITTHSSLKNPKGSPNECSEWLPESIWNNICLLSEVSKPFEAIDAQFKENQNMWKNFYESPEPHTQTLPHSHSHLTIFQKLCLVKYPFFNLEF